MRLPSRTALVVALAVGALVGPRSFAAAQGLAPDPFRCSLGEASVNYEPSRVDRFEVDDELVLTLLPPGYRSSDRSYPVIYLIQGGVNDVTCFLGKTDLIEFTARQRPERQAIVVMPDVTSGPVWHGPHSEPADERSFIDRLLPRVDARYRTLADRSYRAIAGFSAGGLGALHLAGRHPDLFGHVASFSGVAEVSEHDPFLVAVAAGADAAATLLDDPAGDVTWGNPVTDALGWHNANPVDMAPNYGGVTVSLFSGNGIPCDAKDVGVTPTADFWPPGFWAVEADLHRMASHLSAALKAAGVPHSYAQGCGVHSYRYVQRDLHQWWGPMFQAFGKPPPTSFDYRRADPDFSVWGWRFQADTRRAAEFLDIRNASVSGLTLKGSGTQRVITAGYFAAGEIVMVRGAQDRTVTATADGAGRISFLVDLGPPHRFQQYTAQARAVQAVQGGDYFETRTVTFAPH